LTSTDHVSPPLVAFTVASPSELTVAPANFSTRRRGVAHRTGQLAGGVVRGARDLGVVGGGAGDADGQRVVGLLAVLAHESFRLGQELGFSDTAGSTP